MLSTIISHAVTALLAGALGWWIGKKGGANVAGDVKVAIQDTASTIKKA